MRKSKMENKSIEQYRNWREGRREGNLLILILWSDWGKPFQEEFEPKQCPGVSYEAIWWYAYKRNSV